jgi:hypothetical protein
LALKNGSSGGIEWTDVMAMAGAIESLHDCRINVVFTTRGQGHNGNMHIVVNAAFAVLPGSDLPKAVSVQSDWPSSKAKSVMGLVYNLMWQLDYAIQQAYEQMPMTGGPPLPGE